MRQHFPKSHYSFFNMYLPPNIKIALIIAGIISSLSLCLKVEAAPETRPSAPENPLVLEVGHRDDVHQILFSPDSQLFASASSDRTIELHRATDGVWLKTLRGAASGINCLSFAPSGLLASGSSDNTVLIWDIKTGTTIRKFKIESTTDAERENGVLCLAFSPDGKALAAISAGGVIHLRDANSGALLRNITSNLVQPSLLTYSADSQSLFAGENRKAIQSWSAQMGTALPTLNVENLPGTPLAISSDGRKIAFQTPQGQLLVWDARNSKPIVTVAPPRAVRSVAFSSDGKVLLGALASNLLVAWNEKGEIFQAFETGLDMSTLSMSSLASSPDGKRAATSNRDGTIKLWDMTSGKLQARLASFRLQARQIVCGKNTIIGGYDEGSIFVWDSATGKLQKTFRNPARTVTAAAISPDGATLAVVLSWSSYSQPMQSDGVANQDLQFWDTRTWKLIRNIKIGDYNRSISSLKFSPDGALLAGGTGAISYDDVRLWDVKTGEQKSELGQRSRLTPSAVDFSPDGTLIGSSSDSGSGLQFWKLADKIPLLNNLNGSSAKVRALTFTSNSQVVVASNYGLKIFDLAAKEWLPNIEKVGEESTQLALSANGSTLASVHQVGTVKLWNTADWKFKGYLQSTNLGAHQATFADDRRLVTDSEDGSLKLWAVSDGHLLATLQVLPSVGPDDNAPEWITSTPRGYYVASTGATQFLHLADGASVPALQIASKYSKPEEVKKSVGLMP